MSVNSFGVNKELIWHHYNIIGRSVSRLPKWSTCSHNRHVTRTRKSAMCASCCYFSFIMSHNFMVTKAKMFAKAVQ